MVATQIILSLYQHTHENAMTIWLNKLEQYEREGFREIPGKASNPRILKWAHGAGHAKWVTGDDTPWCGIGLAGVLDECGLGELVPPDPAKAISWLQCGSPCELVVGAIVVLPRTGGNHVTVCKRINANGTFDGLGCNQGDAIKTSPFPVLGIKGCRWPIETVSYDTFREESRIADAAARQQGDMAKSGTLGAPSAAAPDVPALPGWRDNVSGWLDNLGWFRGIANTAVEFTAFLAGNWRIIAGAIALFFLIRIAWDSKRIKAWRLQDRTEGRTI